MEKTDRYPETRQAVPMDSLHTSRTSRLLTPGIVSVAVLILLASSIMGIVIVVSIFDSASPRQAGECATQVFMLIASSVSVVYVMLHFLAMLKNEPIGIVRPPEIRIHGYCFIAARLAMVAWTIALIVASVVASNPSVCLRRSRDCKLQILDVVGSSLAFLSTGALLTALESRHDPFQIPYFLHISRTITCRVSEFGSEFFVRSTRTSVLDDESVFEDIQYLSSIEHPNNTNKSLPPNPPRPRKSSVPVELRMECPAPMAQKLRAKGWGEEWTHLARDTSTDSMTRTFSSTSVSESSSCTSTSDRSTNTSVSKRASRQKSVTPSSSIHNMSRRSPLSTMRSIEFPDVPIPAQLRYLPPVIAPPHEWNHSKTASLTQLLPVADRHTPKRRSSITPPAMRIMGPVPMYPPEFAPNFKRTTLDVKIPGAFIDYHPSLEAQIKLEEHSMMIEQESIARVVATQKAKCPGKLPNSGFERNRAPYTPDSRSVYRQHKAVQPSTTTFQSTGSDLDSAVCMEAVKIEFVKPSNSGNDIRESRKQGHFRRLTIGDISPELGILWDNDRFEMGG